MTQVQPLRASDYRTHASFVPELGKAVLDLLTVPAGARVLDLGCGDGVLSQELRARGFDVVGVDTSPSMVAAARAAGIDALCADGHDLPFAEQSFHAVFSSATLHWLTRPDAVIASVYRALRPGGQFVAELGGKGNTARLVRALVAGLSARGLAGDAAVPWYFPSPGEYATRLEQAGFRVELMCHFDRPTPLPGDILGWIATFGDSFTRLLPEAARAPYLSEVRAQLASELLNASGTWVLDYVRLRFRATKPG